MSEDDGEKRFDPTPQRREQFRKEGRFARARDAAWVAGTLAVLATLLGSRGTSSRAIDLLFSETLGNVDAVFRERPTFILGVGGEILAALAMPAVLAASIAATVLGLVQSGLRFNFDLVSFKPERLNPLPKLAEVFSPKKGTIEAILSMLRVLVVGYVAYRAMLIEAPRLLVLARVPPADALSVVISIVVRVLLWALGALVVIAGADYAQSRFILERDMKMTRKELMDEMRSSEGDPKVKSKMRNAARAAARKRALSNVKTADVVVTNPTHIAVALRYGSKDPAPVVVAKGHDDLALQIRARARRYGVPILENRPLARALDAEVKLGHPVPTAHFAAVARILAFVYRLKRRGTRRA